MIHVCINDVLVITKEKFAEHLRDTGKFLQKLVAVGLKVNAERHYMEKQKLISLVSSLLRTGQDPYCPN